MKIETKQVNGYIKEVKQEVRNGVKVGLISGYIATWDVDRWDDQFVKGCFLESIKEHKKKKRQIRFKDHHGRTIGGYPIEGVFEDEKGLFGTAEVNLEVQQGREAYSLALQGVLVDKSIGFSAVDKKFEGDLRIITKAIVWEGSIVDEPMNENANITEVKTMIKEANTKEEMITALSEIKELPQVAINGIIEFISKKTDLLTVEDLKSMTDRELEEKLMSGVKFSCKKAQIIISALKAAGHRDGDDGSHRDGENWSEVVSELKSINETLKTGA